MTIRAFTLVFYPGAAPAASPGSSRDTQLDALTAFAHRQLQDAFHQGRDRSIHAAARLLLQCHTMLNRWQQYREATGPTPAEQDADREWQYERQAMINVMQARPDIFDLFVAERERLMPQP